MTNFDPTSKTQGGTFVLCGFPKHQGIPWEDVLSEDRPYVEWLISGEGPQMEDELYDFLEEMLTE